MSKPPSQKYQKMVSALKITKEMVNPEDKNDIVTLLSPITDGFQSTESITDMDLSNERSDPVAAANKKDKKAYQASLKPPTPKPVTPKPIEPSISYRLDMETEKLLSKKAVMPTEKFVAPEKKEWKKKKEEIRQKFLDSLNQCDKEFQLMKVPSPQVTKKFDINIETPSPDASKAKVLPRKPSYDLDQDYPDPQSKEQLDVKKPKSGIFINVKKRCPDDKDPPPKQVIVKLGGKKKDQTGDGPPTKTFDYDEYYYNFYEGEGMEEDVSHFTKATQMSNEVLLTKYRRKVSVSSATTSVGKNDLVAENISWDKIPVISKVVQTMRTDQEAAKPKKKIKHGTFESHSFTKLKQPILEKFCYKTVLGTIHCEDPNFSDLSRGKQGICMSVAAFCYSKIKHPKKWNSMTIDDVVELGDQLFHQSIATLHMHNHKQGLKAKELQKFVIIGEQKIRYQIEDPEVVGYVRSTDKRVYNLTKGLKIFFNRRRSGILITDDLIIVIWKCGKKYIYLFDATARAKDLYQDSKGTAVLAKFTKILGVATVLLDRTELGNSPFMIAEINVKKVVNKDDAEEEVPVDESSKYNIINESKAVVKGTFDLSDKCFGFARNKQALTMACVALVYSRITPPNSWHRKTIDKIMVIGNQLFVECQKTEKLGEMKLENMPALFTIGPYIVNIYIFANRFVDLMFKKGQNCLCVCLEDFFQTCTNAILEIGKHTLAVWNQRNMMYMFDPYSRNLEGLNCRSGTACVSMHSDVKSLCETIGKNFPEPDVLFRIHPLKVLKIHRDNAMSKVFPKTMQMNDFPVETFRCQKMKKSKKKAVDKPITVHMPGCAMKKLLAGESPGPSLVSIVSNVESITADLLPKLPVILPKMLPKTNINELGVVADLDSPSLSDTQIEPPRPKPFGEEEIDLMDLDSFKLTQEEVEMLGKGEGENEKEGKGMGAEGAELESYFALTQRNQVHSGSLAAVFKAVDLNTDLTYKYKILPALEYPIKIKKDATVKLVDIVCQKKAYENKRNYKDIGGDKQIIFGQKCIYDFVDDDEAADKITPYVAIMAITLSQEFPPSRWHSKCLDFILQSGCELYGQHQDHYNNIGEFSIKFIDNEYQVAIENVFDTYLGKDLLASSLGVTTIEDYITKELFANITCGIILTPGYLGAIILFNSLYYLYLPYNCNVKGKALRQGDGYACVQRFKTLEPLINLFFKNRAIHLDENDIEYLRFVLLRPVIIRDQPANIVDIVQAAADREIDVSQSKELAKESNFVSLPDDSQIVIGTTNIANFGEEPEYMAPCTCIMAAIAGKKYNVLTWSPEVIDYILQNGSNLFTESNIRFDEIPKLEIQSIRMGRDEFSVVVTYLYDGLSKEKIIANALNEVLIQDGDWHILVTKNYSCAIYLHNYLYYLFECFGCNDVGLGEGLDNTGKACVCRFKNVKSMAARIAYNKRKRELSDQIEYVKFVLSVCKVKKIYKREKKKTREELEREEQEQEMLEMAIVDENAGEEEGESQTDIKIRQAKNIIGYRKLKTRMILPGDKALTGRKEVSAELKADHFVCLCACLMVINHPIDKWDTKRVNTVIEMGEHVFSHASNKEISPKRTVRNILMGQYFFDVSIRKIVIPTWKNNRNLDIGLNTVLSKRKYCIVQFPNCSYVVYRDENAFHLFDPYGPPEKKRKKDSNQESNEEEPKAAWVQFNTLGKLRSQITRNIQKGCEAYTFYTFDVLNIRKASKKILMAHKLAMNVVIKDKSKELKGEPFYENETWLEKYKYAWSRIGDNVASGEKRGTPQTMWHNWDVEYPKDLYSLTGTLHQNSKKFSLKTRGKQTLCNLILAIGMTNVYDFPEWNSHVIDSILINGDKYFKECIKEIKEDDHEIVMEDLKLDCELFPYEFQINIAPVVQGTMFLESKRKFNLYKALKSFFDNYESRSGIIACTKQDRKKFLSFGKTQDAEYFMFDCSTIGTPMFPEGEGFAYVLRCTTFNRLLYCLVVTLNGGEFYIYDIETYNFNAAKEKNK